MKCQICFARFDAKEDRDRHLADRHDLGPLAPRPVCPPSMAHVRELLIDAKMPDWIREAMADLGHPRHRDAQMTWGLLRDWNEADVDSALTVLHDAGYYLVKRATHVPDPAVVGAQAEEVLQWAKNHPGHTVDELMEFYRSKGWA